MRLCVLQNKEYISQWTAAYLIRRINDFKPTAERPFVLGLPTGGSIEGVYALLVEAHKHDKISFQNVITFNMDEYVGLAPSHVQSYRYFMDTHLFNHIDIPKANINTLNGLATDRNEECQRYEAKIKDLGGIELLIGGVGQDGHIAFNEPGSSLQSYTRVKTLTPDTIEINARFFDDPSEVPTQAMTMGVSTILETRETLIIASGLNKALAVQAGLEGSINQMMTISALQMHQNALLLCDVAAASEIKIKNYLYFQSLNDYVNAFTTQHFPNWDTNLLHQRPTYRWGKRKSNVVISTNKT